MGNSSILALGNHPVGSGWKINDILLHNECLTTSGNDSPSRRHIVSPQNGKLVEGVKQIAVVTTNGSIGEILSTSLFAADSEQRKALLAESSSVLNRFSLLVTRYFLGRVVLLDRVYWDDKAWPNLLGNGSAVKTETDR